MASFGRPLDASLVDIENLNAAIFLHYAQTLAALTLDESLHVMYSSSSNLEVSSWLGACDIPKGDCANFFRGSDKVA